MISPLHWATLVFTGAALATGDFAMVDFHSASSILGAATVLFAGLAGLCMHPPWTPGASDVQAAPEPVQLHAAPAAVVAPDAAPVHQAASAVLRTPGYVATNPAQQPRPT